MLVSSRTSLRPRIENGLGTGPFTPEIVNDAPFGSCEPPHACARVCGGERRVPTARTPTPAPGARSGMWGGGSCRHIAAMHACVRARARVPSPQASPHPTPGSRSRGGLWGFFASCEWPHACARVGIGSTVTGSAPRPPRLQDPKRGMGARAGGDRRHADPGSQDRDLTATGVRRRRLHG